MLIYIYIYSEVRLTDTGSTDILLIRHEFSGPRQHSYLHGPSLSCLTDTAYPTNLRIRQEF